MNWTLISGFWRERLRSPIRLVILFFVMLETVAVTLMTQQFSKLPGSLSIFGIGAVLGAGIIGRDLSSGVLQLILARPVRRWEYVLSRWIALSIAILAVSWLLDGIVLLIEMRSGAFDTLPALPVLASALGEHVFAALGFAAVLTGLSSLERGFADLGLLLIGSVGLSLIGLVARWKNLTWLTYAVRELEKMLFPAVSFAATDPGTSHFYQYTVWASAVTLFLLLGVVAMNRRELSYGSSG